MAELKEILDSLKDYLQEVSFQSHQVVFKDGDDSREMYFITEGKVHIVKSIAGKGNKILAVLGADDIFGEGALLTDKPRGASAQALTATKAYKLTYESFQKLLLDEPSKVAEMLIEIIEIVNGRLQYVNSELITLYDVMRILSNSPDDIGMVAHDIIEKFIEVSAAQEGVIFLHNVATEREDVLATSDNSTADFVTQVMGGVSEKAEEFMQNSSIRYDNGEEKVLWIPVRSLEGKYLGVVVLNHEDGSFADTDVKLAVAITEQLGTVVERHYSKESDKERVRLKQQIVSGL